MSVPLPPSSGLPGEVAPLFGHPDPDRISLAAESVTTASAFSRLNYEDPLLRFQREQQASKLKNRLRVAYALGLLVAIGVSCFVTYHVGERKLWKVYEELSAVHQRLSEVEDAAAVASARVDTGAFRKTDHSLVLQSVSKQLTNLKARVESGEERRKAEVGWLEEKMASSKSEFATELEEANAKLVKLKADLGRQKGLVDARIIALAAKLDQMSSTSFSSSSSSASNKPKSNSSLLFLEVDSLRTRVDEVERSQEALAEGVAPLVGDTTGFVKWDEFVAAKKSMDDALDKLAALENLTAAVATSVPETTVEVCKKAVEDKLASLLGRDASTSPPANKSHAAEDEVSRLQQDLRRLNGTVMELRINSVFGDKLPKSCSEVTKFGLTSSGVYEIDPDGFAMGEHPIKVYCDLEAAEAVTEVQHDSESFVDVRSCTSKDCFHHAVTYRDATTPQIRSLIALSEHCEQHMEFDCLHAPLKGYGYWLDGSGEQQTYLHGSNHGQQMCGCSADDTCKFSPTKERCNCDVLVGANDWMRDFGVISNMSALPITGFQYGFLDPTSKAKFRREGVGRSGLYLLQKDNDNPSSSSRSEPDLGVYSCDMSKETTDWAIETLVLPLSREEEKASFGVLLEGGITDGPVRPYTSLLYELGTGGHRAFDLARGTFTAPASGTYRFQYSGICQYNNVRMYAKKNDNTIFQFWHNDGGHNYRGCSQTFVMPLASEDEVSLEVSCTYQHYCFAADSSLGHFFFLGQLV